MEDPSRLRDVVKRFDDRSAVLPRIRWFADEERARELLGFARLAAGEDVLEVGCGPGLVLAQATKVAGRVVGVDVSLRMLQEARGRATTAQLVRGVVEQLPFPDGSFDLAYSRSVLHHALDARSMLRELARVVHKRGRVALNDSIASEVPEWAENHNLVERLRDPSHGKMLPSGELLRAFAGASLRVSGIHEKRYTRVLEEWLDVTSPKADARSEVLRRFERWLSRDESGLHVRREGGKILFDHTQWTILAARA